MDVVIAGGHGKIGLQLGKLLAEGGDRIRGLIRKPEQADDLVEGGVEPVLCDLEGEEDVAAAIKGADAIVFAAGAGSGSGPARKWTLDYGGAAKLIEAAKKEGVGRYVIVSSIGAGSPPAEGGGSFGEYLRAKAKADRELEASGLDHTIVRSAGLTDEPPSGKVTVTQRLERGKIPRADVVEVLAAVLPAHNTIGKTLEVVSGETPIEEAIAAV
ncbi:MAG TPA: SDR family oxidoreductase [Solirubrobacterales bacterium]|nr:SDR family oxidoreductase [Solirubrobacterales bacterium]